MRKKKPEPGQLRSLKVFLEFNEKRLSEAESKGNADEALITMYKRNIEIYKKQISELEDGDGVNIK